jgi:Flp pilus assembly pilin Flp
MSVRQHYELVRAVAIRTDGQTMAEYGVVLGCIVLGVIVALGALVAAISGRLGSVTTVLQSAL